MSSDSLSFEQTLEAVYAPLLPMCQDNYSKRIHSAWEMYETGRGNCYTFAEAACLRLLGEPVVRAAGIRLSMAPRLTNQHAACIAFANNREQTAALVDLMCGEPLIMVPEECDQTQVLYTFVNQVHWLYAYRLPQETGYIKKPRHITRRPEAPFTWPPDSTEHRVYMPALLGTRALHAIAKAETLKHDEGEEQYQQALQTAGVELPALAEKL